MVSVGIQDNYGERFLNEVDKLNIKVYELEKELTYKLNQLKSSKEAVSKLTDGIFISLK